MTTISLIGVLISCFCVVCLQGTISQADKLVPYNRLVFGSCFNPEKDGGIWKLINMYSPNQLVLLGDQFYADMTADFRRRKEKFETLVDEYRKFNSIEEWKELRNGVDGWTATFDDHDYGSNNGDKRYRFRNASQDLFWEFTNGTSISKKGVRKSGVYSSKYVHVKIDNDNIYTYKIILLDSRSNKDPVGTINGDFLGTEQWHWLVEELLDPLPRLFVLGSSIQILPDDKLVEENWNEFPKMRERLLKLVATVTLSDHQDVILLSGDIHSAELSQAKGIVSLAHDKRVGSSPLTGAGGVVSLVELTSSGLSHTFTESTVLRNASKSVASMTKTSSVLVPVEKRGFLHSAVFWLYQAFYPAHYREDKRGHFFAGVHFGVLDIVSSAGYDLGLLFRTVSSSGEVVMSKALPLKPLGVFSSSSAVPDSNPLSLRNIAARADNNVTAILLAMSSGSGNNVHIELEPIRGKVPRWRRLVFKAAIALAALLFIVLPVFAVLWLLFAAVYRFSRGHDDAEEALRRERIEEVHRILAKQNAAKSD